jgi:hypothetical protein
MRKALLALVVGLAALWVLTSLLASKPTVEIETPLILDFKDPGRGGGLAFYLQCKQLWPGTRRVGWERNWQNESLIVISLARCEQSTLDRLLEWVRQGGRAVVLTFQHERFIQEMGLDYRYSSAELDQPRGTVRTRLGPVLVQSDGTTTLYARQKFGKGELVVLIDPWTVCNDGLDRGNNPDLPRLLVGERATFLCPASDLEWESLLLRSPWTRGAAGGALVLLLLMVVNEGRPWGRRRQLPGPGQRSMMELLEALAWLCLNAGAYRQTAQMVVRGAAVRLGFPLENLDPELSSRLREAADKPVSPWQMLKLVREVQKKTAEAQR